MAATAGAVAFVALSGLGGWYAGGGASDPGAGGSSGARPAASSGPRQPEQARRRAAPPTPGAPTTPEPAPRANEYGRTLSATLQRLNRQRATLERRLRTASDSRQQARAARRLGVAYADAAASLEGAPGSPNPPASSALVAALKRAAAAYDGMAMAADRGDARRFQAAARQARREEDVARRELGRLSRPGSLPAEPS